MIPIGSCDVTPRSKPRRQPSPVIPTELESIASLHDFPAHCVLFHRGQPTRHVWIVREGVVKLLHEGEHRTATVAFRSSGSLLGGSGAVTSGVQPVTAGTLTACTLWQLPVDPFLSLVGSDAHVSLWLITRLALESHDHLAAAFRFSTVRPRARLLQVLRMIARDRPKREQGGAVRIDLPITRQELAEATGITREHVTRLLSRLEAEGLIVRAKGWIVVRPPEQAAHPTHGG